MLAGKHCNKSPLLCCQGVVYILGQPVQAATQIVPVQAYIIRNLKIKVKSNTSLIQVQYYRSIKSFSFKYTQNSVRVRVSDFLYAGYANIENESPLLLSTMHASRCCIIHIHVHVHGSRVDYLTIYNIESVLMVKRSRLHWSEVTQPDKHAGIVIDLSVLYNTLLWLWHESWSTVNL